MKTTKSTFAAALICLFSTGIMFSGCGSSTENAADKVEDAREDVIEAQRDAQGNIAEEQAELDSARPDLSRAGDGKTAFDLRFPSPSEHAPGGGPGLDVVQPVLGP